MSRTKLMIATKKLKNAFSMVEDFEFLLMLSNVDRMQSSSRVRNPRSFTAPREASEAKLGDPFYAPKWTLEDMANYKLVTPVNLTQKSEIQRRMRVYSTNSWSNFSFFYNLTHHYQDMSDGKRIDNYGGIGILGPIGQKQFPFQRGFFNRHHLYKNALLFSGKDSQSYMKEKLGLSFDEFSKCSFALTALLFESPAIKLPLNFRGIDLQPETSKAFVEHIAGTLPNVRALALEIRRGRKYDTYAPSVLRTKPCIIKDGFLICPVLPLLTERVTSGIYYDLIDGPDNIRNEIGKNFETYSKQLLESAFSDFDCIGEIKYGPKGRQKDSSDIMLGNNNEISLLVECKATRLSFDSKFSLKDEDPVKIKEIVKGVIQIWRTAAALRTGKLMPLSRADNLIGVVLTLDTWNLMNIGRYDRVLDAAHELAAGESNINSEDKIPVALCDAEDFADLCATANMKTFRETIKLAPRLEWKNWSLSNIHKKHFPDTNENKEYGFVKNISSVLSWWSKIDELIEERERGKMLK